MINHENLGYTTQKTFIFCQDCILFGPGKKDPTHPLKTQPSYPPQSSVFDLFPERKNGCTRSGMVFGKALAAFVSGKCIFFFPTTKNGVDDDFLGEKKHTLGVWTHSIMQPVKCVQLEWLLRTSLISMSSQMRRGTPKGWKVWKIWDLALKGRVSDLCQDPKTPVAGMGTGIRAGKSKLNPFSCLFV